MQQAKQGASNNPLSLPQVWTKASLVKGKKTGQFQNQIDQEKSSSVIRAAVARKLRNDAA